MSDNKEEKKLEIDPRILTAVKMLKISFDNSRAYSDTVATEEQRLEQLKRVQNALDGVAHKEAVAYHRLSIKTFRK